MDKSIKVGDVVSGNISTAHVFKKYGIDFCCGGGISIEKACEKKEVIVDELLKDLMNVDNSILPSQNFNNWELDFLIDYIVNIHHKYIHQSFNILDDYASKVVRVHGDKLPALMEIKRLYNELKNELLLHMHKEEMILFPFIKKLYMAKSAKHPMPLSTFGSVQNPIVMMLHEHDTAGELLREISCITLNYEPPVWACNTFRAMYAKQDEFEQDLHIHIHLENNILFPKAMELEQFLN